MDDFVKEQLRKLPVEELVGYIRIWIKLHCEYVNLWRKEKQRNAELERELVRLRQENEQLRTDLIVEKSRER